MRKMTISLALAALVAIPALAQSDAKGIYVDGAKPALKYKVLLQRDGETREVRSTTTFRSGDRLKLQFDLNRDSYVYVLHREVEGTSDQVDRYSGTRGIEVVRDEDRRSKRRDSWQLLFPSKDAGRNNLLKARQASTVPSTAWFKMDNVPGMEKLVLVASPKPIRIEDYFDIETGRMREGGKRESGDGSRKNEPRNDSDDDVIGQLTRSLTDYSGNTVAEVSTKGIEVEVDGYAGAKDPAKPIVITVDLRHIR